MHGRLASRPAFTRRFGWLIVFCCWLTLLPTGEAAARVPRARYAPEVQVLTFGPGDHPFSRFGHNAVAVIDPATQRGRVYNFGTFSFNSPNLISDFLEGRLRYWVSVTRLEDTLASYRRQNRTIFAQRLALRDDERRQLLEALRVAALPENKFYRYDYYQDNCSTRVRDILDRVFDGALSRQAARPAQLSWREHTSRLTEPSLGVYLGLNVALAGGVDTPQTRWEEMFLPEVLRQELSSLEHDGRRVVAEETVLFRAKRPTVPERPAQREGWMLLTGLLLSLVLYGLSRYRARVRWLGYPWWLLLTALSLVSSFLGGVFWLFWLGTDHEIAHANENLFLFPVWMLVVPVATAAAMLGKHWGHAAFRWAMLATLASALIGLCAKALPWCSQDNWQFICLLLPVWMTLAWTAETSWQTHARQRAAHGAEGSLKARAT